MDVAVAVPLVSVLGFGVAALSLSSGNEVGMGMNADDEGLVVWDIAIRIFQ